MKATARMKTTTDFTDSTDSSAYFSEKDKRKSTNGNNSVTHGNKKISHDVMIKFSREFHRNVVR